MNQRIEIIFRNLVAVTVAVLVVFSQHTNARTIYVNNVTGDDRSSGQEEQLSGSAGPVRTINRALAIAMPSDRVIVANTEQPYREAIALSGPRLHGTEGRPFVIQSSGAVIDGAVSTKVGAWRHVDDEVFAFRPRRLTYQQIFKDGKPLSRVSRAVLFSGQRLEPLQWALANDGVLLRVEEGQLPRDYDLRHAELQTGITLYNTKHVVVDGFVIQGFQQDGVNAHELVRHSVLRNIECRANGRSGLSVGGVSRVTVENSSFYDNGRVQIRTEGGARLELNRCELDGATAPEFNHRGRSLLVNGNPAIFN